jgi:hypothetical protein
MNTANSAVADLISPVLSRLAQLAPRPTSLEATGLAPNMLADLVLKHLLRTGPLTSAGLGERLGLAGPVLEPILQFLRHEGRVQLQARGNFDNELRLALTDRGRAIGTDALQACGYVGPAPVPFETYARVVRAQTVPRRSLTREGTRLSFSGTIMADELCDRLGVAMASGRAIVIYGPAGSGKTYIASRLIGALSGEVLIPHAIAVNDNIIRVFDAAVHEGLELLEGNRRLLLAQGYDARFALCERPLVIAGGELTLDMLEVQFNAATREHHAPLQMKANNGVLLIDDLGRQPFLPQRLFDRWLVPLEQRIDYLTAAADARFAAPFDAIIVFSTNREPAQLADDAAIRRLGYKIEFGPLSVDLYTRVWAAVCAEMEVPFEQELLNYALSELYPATGQPLLACHPRELIGMALDKAAYDERSGQFEAKDLQWAWQNYFLPNLDCTDRGEAAAAR